MTNYVTNADLQAFVEAFMANQIDAEAKALYNNPLVQALFTQLTTQNVSVLPYFRKDIDVWMIVADHRPKLDSFMRDVSRFMVPTYAMFSEGTPFIRTFDATNNLGKVGGRLFVGYYRLESDRKDRQRILTRLNDCLQVLNRANPDNKIALGRESYRTLLDAFQRALTAHQWDEAERLLNQISVECLTSSENTNFLRITWLARQSRWQDIWKHPRFDQLAKLTVPRQIRADLLTAFHHVNLLALEGDEKWDEVLGRLETYRPKMAMLLMGRFTLNHPAVLRVYAYLAVLDQDRDMLIRIEADIPQNDYQTRLIVQVLLARLPKPESALSPEEKLKSALLSADYDTAWHFSERLTDPMERLATRIQTAYLSKETALIQIILDEHKQLFLEDQQVLYGRYPKVENWIRTLDEQVNNTKLAIRTWSDWFQYAQHEPDSIVLLSALDQLNETTDMASWTVRDFKALVEPLAEINNDQYRRQSSYRSAIHHLTNLCITADDFPRHESEAADVYEFLLQFIDQDEHTTTNTGLMLKLQEALLSYRPDNWREAYSRFKAWMSNPVPAMQDQVLEALELLANYGAEPASLSVWFRLWAQNIVTSPVADATLLSVWLSFAHWMQIDDLVTMLGERIAELRGQGVDPLTTLPEKTQIAIFTFDEAVAKRTEKLMLERNAGLDVRICTEKSNNKQVESLARRSDYVIVVTTCISHAIWYAVEPLATNRLVLPRSRGVASILQSLEAKVFEIGNE